MKLYSEHVAALPRALQHLYYVVTACRAVPYRKWVDEGAPNPFVEGPKPRRRVTITQSVMMSICEAYQPDALQKPHRPRRVSLAA
ncbi:MAG: hypothetical protein OIF48_20805 [Silicimonas sp.]|nr:hypothetical protein [Silicimonas sp.]